ncbi:MAG: hypothetical protein Q7K39_02925 [Candidatus Magasanikbacteria bacterium]|nr:hypothetical protein [Candidatus Magasanikbacteria bacterium]
MPNETERSPGDFGKSIEELQKEAFKIVQSEKGLVVSLINKRDNEFLQLEVEDFVRDHLNDTILLLTKDKLLDFISNFNFRYTIYLHAVKNFFRHPGRASRQAKETGVSAALLDQDAQSADRVAYHNSLLKELERKVEKNLTPENEAKIRNVLTIIKGIIYGYDIDEVAKTFGSNGVKANRIYLEMRDEYPDLFGFLPPKPSELRSGSKYWGGPGKSNEVQRAALMHKEPRQDMINGLRIILDEINQAEYNQKYQRLFSIAQKKLLSQAIKYYVGELKKDELDESFIAHPRLLKEVRRELAQLLGMQDLFTPTHSMKR